MATVTQESSAAEYDRLSPFYDAFTDGYAYDVWFSTIEEHALELGLRGRRALDLACGTGKSTEPLLARGYRVLACDNSVGMVRQARLKFPDSAEAFFVADMRELPPLGEVDLVLCLDDAINYLLSDEDLDAIFAGVAGVLSESGVFAFDLNTLLAYRTAFAQTSIRETGDLFFVWRGEGSDAFDSGGVASATVDVFDQRSDGTWRRSFSEHTQRHHPPDVVVEALERAGLRCSSILGQRPGAVLDETYDELEHTKLVYFARRQEALELHG